MIDWISTNSGTVHPIKSESSKYYSDRVLISYDGGTYFGVYCVSVGVWMIEGMHFMGSDPIPTHFAYINKPTDSSTQPV